MLFWYYSRLRKIVKRSLTDIQMHARNVLLKCWADEIIIKSLMWFHTIYQQEFYSFIANVTGLPADDYFNVTSVLDTLFCEVGG